MDQVFVGGNIQWASDAVAGLRGGAPTIRLTSVDQGDLCEEVQG